MVSCDREKEANILRSLFETIAGFMIQKGLTWYGRCRLPQIEGRLSLDWLSADVEIIRDRWGVPHIYAQNYDDLFFAQGFVHAQDRLWQMELSRRTGAGRLSEIFGPVALDTDRAVRTFGFPRLARQDWATASDFLRSSLTAYSHGVNAFLQGPRTRLPLEFSLLRHQPEPWRPEDSLTFLRLMAWQLSHPWYSKIVRAQLIAKVGEKRAAEWDIHYPDQNPVTLPHGIDVNPLDFQDNLEIARSPFLDQGRGSNAWAITGQRTVSGHTFLCNDAHLGLRAPAIWYQNHLVAKDFNVTGVSLPGGPLVFIGHNANIAWGLTVAFTDCEDIFIEKFDPDQPNRYRFQDSWREAEVISETIRIKGRTEPHIERVILTHHGPIISDIIGVPNQRLALQSMSMRQAPGVLDAWWRVNRATGWDDFVEAMRLIKAPHLNIVYADTAGNIGYWLAGTVPIRAKGEGAVPVPGWTGEYEWVENVPFEEMPHALNPAQGYVLSCNHRAVGDDYPYFLGNTWMNGYRARRITEIFERQLLLSTDDFQAIYLDVTCLPGREFVECLATLPAVHPDPDVRTALNLLRNWDGQLTADSIGGALYQVTRYTLIRHLLEPSLGKPLTRRLTGDGFNPVLINSHEFYGYDTVSLLRILKDPDSWWIKEAGGFETTLTISFKQSIQWLRENFGPNPNDWRWGKIHRVFFLHPLGMKKPLDRLFNRGPYPIGGDTDTPCQTAMLPNAPYDNKAWGPSIRQIIDMNDLSRSMISVPPGQSGHVASRHYDDQLLPWLRGEYQPLLWTREQVEENTQGVLRLETLQ